MATRYETPQLVVPANTPILAPVQAPLYANRAAIEQLEVLVPPGPSGLVGFAFWHSSRQVIPKIDGTWIIADGETVRIQIADLNPFPNWTIRAYNLDSYPHTLYVRVALDDTVTVVPDTVPLIPIE